MAHVFGADSNGRIILSQIELTIVEVLTRELHSPLLLVIGDRDGLKAGKHGFRLSLVLRVLVHFEVSWGFVDDAIDLIKGVLPSNNAFI